MPLNRLAVVYRKLAEIDEPKRADWLREGIEFMQILAVDSEASRLAERHLLAFEARLAEDRVTVGDESIVEDLRTWLQEWDQLPETDAERRWASYAKGTLWNVLGEHAAIDVTKLSPVPIEEMKDGETLGRLAQIQLRAGQAR